MGITRIRLCIILNGNGSNMDCTNLADILNEKGIDEEMVFDERNFKVMFAGAV